MHVIKKAAAGNGAAVTEAMTSPSRRAGGGLGAIPRTTGNSAENQPLLSAHNRASSYEDIDSALDSDDNIFTGQSTTKYHTVMLQFFSEKP